MVPLSQPGPRRPRAPSLRLPHSGASCSGRSPNHLLPGRPHIWRPLTSNLPDDSQNPGSCFTYVYRFVTRGRLRDRRWKRRTPQPPSLEALEPPSVGVFMEVSLHSCEWSTPSQAPLPSPGLGCPPCSLTAGAPAAAPTLKLSGALA